MSMTYGDSNQKTDNKSETGLWALGFKGITLFLKSIKLLKFVFAGATFLSYAYLFTWKFALLILLAIGWHESGHVWATRRMGLKTKGFYFLPFLGGVAITEERYKTQGQQAFIAIMGPVWGFVLALAAFGIYWVTGNPLFAAAASWMSLLNLFNLLPVNPLDGGQVIRTVSFSIHNWLGSVFLGLSIATFTAAAFIMKVPLFGILAAVAALEFGLLMAAKYSEYKYEKALAAGWNVRRTGWNTPLENHQTSMSGKQIALTLVVYLVLIVALFALMRFTQHIPGADLAMQLLQS